MLPSSFGAWKQVVQVALALAKDQIPRPDHFQLFHLKSHTPIDFKKVPNPPPPAPGIATKESAVLVLLQPNVSSATEMRDMNLLLTMRSSRLRAHSKQMAFPGGRLDPGETPEDAAIRESFEEVGLMPDAFEVLGRLKPIYSSPSKSWVAPVVAISSKPVAVRVASPDEVDSIHYLHLSQLLCKSHESHHALAKYFSHMASGAVRLPCFFASDEPDRPINSGVHPARGSGPLQRRGDDGPLVPVHISQCDGTLVWGLTAAIICELAARLAAAINQSELGRHGGQITLSPSPYIVRDPDDDLKPFPRVASKDELPTIAVSSRSSL